MSFNNMFAVDVLKIINIFHLLKFNGEVTLLSLVYFFNFIQKSTVIFNNSFNSGLVTNYYILKC